MSAHTNAIDVEGELRAGIHRIRGALTELFESAAIDASAPQVVSRTVGINRNLAWKLSKIIGSDEPLSTIEHLPGGSGLEIMLEAFERAGAPSRNADQVRRAMTEFDQTVELHVGDRATLDMMLGHMLPSHLRVERGEAARKLAFQGNSAIWGIQARVRLASLFFAPNADDPTQIDVANAGGLIDYRRLHAGKTWPLLRVHGYEDDGTSLRARPEPLDPSVAPGEAPLMKSFCTGAPVITSNSVPGGTQFDLEAGPLGNHGSLTSIFGTIWRRFASCYRDEQNDRGEQMVHWFTPVATSVTTMVVHRSLPFAMPPKLDVFGRLTPTWGETMCRRECERVELAETIQHLGDGPPVFSTPVVPEYAEITTAVFERLGWDARDFTAYRLIVNYPPIPATAILSFPLPERP